MATTTNYSWSTPDDTALVKDGAAAIRSLGTAIDSTVFTNASAAVTKATVDAKGDLIAGTADNTVARLAVGANNTILTADSSTATGLKWAAPASGSITWTARLGSLTAGMTKVEYNGSDLYVAVGVSGLLYSSPDAITWTARTSGFGANTIYDVAFGNGLWVAVGNNGTLTTSSDGITWTSRTANMSTNRIWAVKYQNSIWVAVGAGGGTTNTGGIIYSTDGITWTRKNQSLTVGATYYDVIWNGTNWVVVANVSTNNHLYATTPSGTWTVGDTGSAAGVYRIFWDGTRHITSESSFRLRYSTSTTLGTTTAYNYAHEPFNELHGYTYYDNNKVYVQNGKFWATITPSSTASVISSTPNIVPTQVSNVSGTGADLEQNGSAIWSGAAGLIFAGTTGIYTSF